LSAHCPGPEVGGVGGEDGDEGGEQESSGDVGGGVGVASFDSGRESKLALR
jgi:hypothetical protein